MPERVLLAAAARAGRFAAGTLGGGAGEAAERLLKPRTAAAGGQPCGQLAEGCGGDARADAHVGPTARVQTGQLLTRACVCLRVR